jgi:glutamine synthetase
MSRRFASFVAGMIQGGREYSYLSAPSINSYKRFQDESFAPCQMVLGLDNRTCGFRLVGEGASFRVESRLPGADANPYLALAGLVSSGLDGFEANLAAPETYQGNAYENHSLPRVPSTMREAVSLFSNGEKVRSALGADVHEHLVNFAAQELRSFEQETVTDWEMMRYFERI